MAGVPANWTWAGPSGSPGPCVVFDLDGVIADAWHRQHHLDGPRRDWKSFFAACHLDEPLESTISLGRAIDASATIVILTARPASVHGPTLSWLEEHDVRWDLLIMRGAGDRGSPSPEYKRRSITELRRFGFEILVALDDDLRNIEMLDNEDVPAVYVHSGYYERD